jgi:UDP-N-acetylglucosamine acyltransferase
VPAGEGEKSIFNDAHLCLAVVTMIHPSAVIHPQAKLGNNVHVGPCAVIEAGVELGDDCIVGPQVCLLGATTIGKGNRFHAGCVIGDAPVDVKYKGEPTRLRIGDHNIFREHVTVNTSNNMTEDTVIGSHNFLTPHSHVGHNCVIGNHVILGGGCMIAGHVTIQDRVFVSGNCLVHQFCRIGTLAMMQGGSAISKDLPPFTVATGVNEICGLNTVGLRRAGLTAEERMEVKRLYRELFRSGKLLREAVAEAQKSFTSPGAKVLLEFVAAAKRGVCADTSAGGHQPEET